MSTEIRKIEIKGLEISTIRKNIKNLHLGVYPPNGRIRVAAPLKTSDEAIRLLVISKIPWIKKQQLKFNNQERQTKREFVSGESHYFLGNRYRLNIMLTNLVQKVEIKRKSYVDLHVRQETTAKKREEIMDDFYRKELKKKIPVFIEKWHKIMGVSVKEFQIKKMKTKWGTCNSKYERIWINLELAKKPLHCLEYILVHEMVHFLEKNHTERFNILMNSFMPQWQQYKEELNKYPLSHSTWEY